MSNPKIDFQAPVSRSQFLDHYWQKRPALLRAAIDPDICSLTPDELAGLACEEDIESRLIQRHADDRWSLRHGPFEEHEFNQLPETAWTLLVQDVDKHVTAVAELLDAFDFLPDWRLDDIMISYATDQGGVGPHTDNYDVFLIQARGKRRWRLSERHYSEADLLPDSPLRILRDFQISQDLTLDPGDILYLPPNVAHWGTAIGECMTWSVGMRGDSDAELVAAWLEQLPLHAGRPHLRDSLDSATQTPSLVTETDLEHTLTTMAHTLPRDTPAFRRWLGCHLTEPKPGFEILPGEVVPEPSLEQRFLDGSELRRHPWARFALIRVDAENMALCCQGEAVEYPMKALDTLNTICRYRHLSSASFAARDIAQARKLIPGLVRRGWLYFDE